jgi:type I restriction enzyme S subunit
LSNYKSFKFQLPSKSEQERIADILSNYDDLIENNRRRIQLLERSLHLLYKEWFVHLRFPSHEHSKIIDGIPEGWERKPFSHLADFINGFAFKPEHLGDQGLPIVKIPELRDGITSKTPRNLGDIVPDKNYLYTGDILFSWSGTILVNIWNHGEALLNQHLFKVVPKTKELYGFVYIALQNSLILFANETTGATMKHFRRSALDNVSVAVPNTTLLKQFDDTVSPVLSQISNLQRQTTKLQQARDLLLPKLMSGAISV